MSGESFDLRRVDLNLLLAFDALMAERGVTAAAARMSITQSAMSAALARLRRLFDDPIMVRDGRTMTVSPLAEALTGQVRDILNEVQSLLASRSEFDPATDRRTFTITTSDYEGIAVLHPLLQRLATEAPGVLLRIQPAEHEIADRLARNQVDLVVAPREVFPRVGDFHHEELYTDRHVIVGDARNPLLGETITVERFSAMPYVATHLELYPSLVEAHLDRVGIARNVQMTVGFLLAPMLVQGTSLITLTSEILARRLSGPAGLRLLEPPMELPLLSTTMAWTPRVHDDPAHRWLRSRLREVAREATGLP
ncbi:MAG: hypothetical protein BGO95_08735 [Micrococcales bacterium 73-13]|nr:MAG: hypothetical protein BGO95_08735 [Micrococcales bacterium 73-13]